MAKIMRLPVRFIGPRQLSFAPMLARRIEHPLGLGALQHLVGMLKI